jgi:hypothetical protein
VYGRVRRISAFQDKDRAMEGEVARVAGELV